MRKVYLADVLSVSRIALGPVVAALVWQGHMSAACLALLVGLGTDLVDGFVARREGKPRSYQPNLDLDSMCDLVLQLGAIAGLGLSGHVAWHWIGLALVIWSPFALLYAVSRQGTRLYVAMNAITAFSSIVSLHLCFYGYLYWGISTSPTLLALYLAVVVAVWYIKRQRILDWLHGRP